MNEEADDDEITLATSKNSMQNRYCGDIGDYIKFSLLRSLSVGRALGIAWWLYPDEHHNADGRHVAYLPQPDRWRHYDPKVFEHLASAAEWRSVSVIEESGLFPGAIFASDPLPVLVPAAERVAAREAWFQKVKTRLTDCDLHVPQSI